MDFGRPQILSGIHESNDGTLTFFDENGKVVQPARIEVGAVYNRATKARKVLTRQLSEPSKIQLDPNRALSRFAFLIAVDTNTVTIDDRRVSISASVMVQDIRIDSQSWNAKLVPQDAFEFHDATDSPERIGWWDTIRRLTANPFVRPPIGLIVDSDLGSIAAINARRTPLLRQFFVPQGIELIYGCADRGTREYISNAAIADCDRVASQLLLQISKQAFTLRYSRSEGPPYTQGRYLPV